MDIIERTWEGVGNFFGSVMHGFERGVTAVFGSSNARYVRKLQAKVEAITSLESRYHAMSDSELREQTFKFRERLRAGETLDDLLTEGFAVCREGGRRFLGMRHFDVQLIGGMVLHSGAIGEMMTGEGKTLVATLPAYLNALEGKGVHVVTVNDYLARRDMEWMGPLYMGLGLTVGAIQGDMSVDEKQKAYDCDITYGTNNEFGFDYLRDNMRPAARGDNRYPKSSQQSQGRLNFAIIDEVDNILIDEARTPLIISGPAHGDPKKYNEADRVARQLVREKHFVVNEKDHNVSLTDEGVREAERLAGVESFYTAGNMEWPHLIDNALKAHFLYQRDVKYVVKDGKVIIVDEFTGRLMDGRQWSDGLHQAVEAKEGVKIKEETQTLATITLQNFFKLYNKICGMTGTAMTEASEFWKIYKLDVVAIPTNRKMLRVEHPDVIYRTEREKYAAVADETERLHKYDCLLLKNGDELVGTIVKETDTQIEFQPRESKQKQTVEKEKVSKIERKGRPVLIGTVSIEKSERLSILLEKRGIKHQVLNAKHHKREAEIISQAGRLGAVTIATNMAGRGTDIIMGGNPETMAWAIMQDKYKTRLDVPPAEWEALVREIDEREGMKPEGVKVRELGGLHVIGTERHEARRIDLQLRGRCGRQGDPGSSRFFLSLEDELMRVFAGPWVKTILDSLGMQEGEKIESRMVTRRIEGAQKKVEERHFEARKNLLEYDEVMDEQRKRVYGFRQRILDGGNCREVILDMIRKQVDQQVAAFMQKDYGAGAFAAYASQKLAAIFETRDFRGMDFDQADSFAKDEAKRSAETHVQDGIDENLPGDEEDTGEWNWNAMAKLAQTKWGVQVTDRELKKMGRDHVGEFLIEKAHAAIDKVDLSEGKQLLDEDFGYKSTVAWSKMQFGIALELDEVKKFDTAVLIKHVRKAAEERYAQKEWEFPVIAGLSRFSTTAQGGQMAFDREGITAWARDRFGISLDGESMKSMSREAIRELLLKASQNLESKLAASMDEAEAELAKIYAGGNKTQPARLVARAEQLDALSDWLEDKLGHEATTDQLGDLDYEELELRLLNAVEDKYRPEMRKMERSLLLQIVDTAWKDHLLVMDRLRSSVGLVGYAQVDPKVEYKREGMKIFEQMWTSIGDQSTSLIFRMEQLNDEFIGSMWVETSARHDAPPGASDEFRQTQSDQDSASSSTDTRPEPIRNRDKRVGRNDPCPCGSGKKYKACCMRTDRTVV
ncbi:preprotein translocase, SecA subunit [Pirellula staleyi DSM 6068]|uniref:Protein translocase subunit SecA n=1 Tax=Pirellula staleyi (strain ATCC 27377 / DSM 6068 / ICPB 4128) TaxID=530564 RepID=D2R3W5_PIRSD|nr:preprotein translocase subunit SecA [Pirellula staleyi]ADB18814.1 preprotein translocase, SecA subunit [Pirellula staleyi DSM 6068]